MGYSPWGQKESDTTERLRTHALFQQAPCMCLAWSSRRGYTVGPSSVCALSRGRGGEGLALPDQWSRCGDTSYISTWSGCQDGVGGGQGSGIQWEAARDATKHPTGQPASTVLRLRSLARAQGFRRQL